MEVDSDHIPNVIGPAMDICGDIVFIGPAREHPEESRLSEMVRIKETVKEVYAKLKQMHVKKNVNFYYDMLNAILRR
jgi:hypothetical protein